MTRILLTLLAIIGIIGISGTEASAQATRTWVSGVGDDVNPCSRTAPCKTFAGAISKTAANGTINCIDPGGFGAVTITKNMTIDCESQGGGILAAATNGINVNGADIVVKIRNLAIEGAGSGLVGVNVLNGAAVILDNVSITQFSAGTAACIRVSSSATTELVVNNSRLSDCGIAPSTGGGVVLQPNIGGNTRFALNNVSITNSISGVLASGPTSGSVRGAITDTLIMGSGNGIAATTTGAATRIMVNDTTLVGNLNGVFSGGGAGVVVGNSTITANTTGLSIAAPGTIQTYGNNKLLDNTTSDGTFTAPSVPAR
jgi:hypothetical protein